MTKTETERWQVEYGVRQEQVHLLRVRRPHGRWQPAATAPQHVRDYCGCDYTQVVTTDTLPTVCGTLDELRELVPDTDYPDTLLPTRDPDVVRVEVHATKPRHQQLPRRRGANAIQNFAALCAYFDAAETMPSLNRRVYKDTHCGASCSVYGTYDGAPAACHNPGRTLVVRRSGAQERIELANGELPERFHPEYFTLQTIVEGSDATVDGDPLYFGRCTTQDVKQLLAYLESEAAWLWDQANRETEEAE